jgi:predicted ATP-grasp superfamily ATP-dependent carboligase
MRVFVYEYTCATETRDPAESLRTEGWAMLAAVLEDFGGLPGAEVVTLLREPDLPVPAGIEVRRTGAAEEAPFRELAGAAEYSLVIAPEFDGLLAARCRWVEESGGRLLGPSSAAVEATADKFTLARLLGEQRVPTPPCVLPGDGACPFRFPLVCKPRYGAGSQATFLLSNLADLLSCASRAAAEGQAGDLVLQPFVPGQPASVAFLIGPTRCLPLLPATQVLSQDGRFRYQGGEAPLPPGLARRAVELGRRAVALVSGLRGYVGVDLVLGAADDGSQDQVLEINPRLTTSYVGLRALAVQNLAEMMCRVVAGEDVQEVAWRPGAVRFQACGEVTVLAGEG